MSNGSSSSSMMMVTTESEDAGKKETSQKHIVKTSSQQCTERHKEISSSKTSTLDKGGGGRGVACVCEEARSLLSYVNTHTHTLQHGEAIAVDVPTRTHVQCLQRWKKKCYVQDS